MIYDVPPRVRDGAQTPITDLDRLHATSREAAADPDGFWLDVARRQIAWRTPPTRGLEGGFDTIAERPLTWFADGLLNITESCVDRHLPARADKVALLWEGDQPGEVRRIRYAELHALVQRAAHALAALGVGRDDRVIIYMGMVPEAVIAMLACARLGAVHSVVFGGFSAAALADRIRDSGASLVITQNVAMRGGKRISLKAISDAACAATGGVRHQLVFQRTKDPVPFVPGRDVWWHEALERAGAAPHAPVIVEAEHPLFILYTSGSTGRPKGLVHTTGGYATYASYTHATVFDLREDDVYACVADVGWITGHSYIVYGPLANGATTLLFESTPTHPDASRYWEMVERHRITIFYGAPTALRTLAAAGDDHVKRFDRSSLRVLGSVGEPIDESTWRWYHEVVGEGRCAIVDTWWQTETGGIAISPVAPATPAKPGSATLPLPGIAPSVRGPDGTPLEGPAEGRLCLDRPWPGQARTVWGDHPRFVATYFSDVPGAYFTGDGCRRDEDGYLFITGRVDDVLNVSGHRIGTAEIEAALTLAAAVTEAAVVGYPHERKGQGIQAFVVARGGAEVRIEDLDRVCRERIGAHAKIDRLQIVPALPKTRSGKLMRRILRKLAEGAGDDALGDLSTLADPSLVATIRAGHTEERDAR
ncbi:Acetyl-coenzyme A synthetase [Minicystis rosea]|nr:Acetyl-coenzyme A synthetase [Minicystis rosea]